MTYARLEEQSFRMIEAYRPVLEDAGREPESTFLISLLFMGAGHYAEALALLACLVEHYRRTGNHNSLQLCLINQAVVHRLIVTDSHPAPLDTPGPGG